MLARNPPLSPDSLPKYLAEGLPKQDTATLRETRDYIDDLIEFNERTLAEDDLPEDARIVDEDPSSRGTIVEERVKCGSDCTCNEGNGHGPYLYVYRREGGKLVSKYIGKP